MSQAGASGKRAAPGVVAGVVAAALAAFGGGGAAAEEVMTLQWEAGVIALSPEDIAAAEAGEGAVAVRLAPELAADFADLTEILVGETMAVLLCGREVARPVIRARIEGGAIMVPVADPAAALAVLSGEASCGDG